MSVAIKNIGCGIIHYRFFVYLGWCGIYCTKCKKAYSDEFKEKPEHIQKQILGESQNKM